VARLRCGTSRFLLSSSFPPSSPFSQVLPTSAQTEEGGEKWHDGLDKIADFLVAQARAKRE
jgi:hypothetical protein